MKTGLFLWEQLGRVVFVRILANLLYTYELLCKFRKPPRNRHNIYIGELPSFARGPYRDAVHLQPFLYFRDDVYLEIAEEPFPDLQSEAFYWYTALTYCKAPTPKLGFDETLKRFT